MTACLCPSCCALPAPTYTEEHRRWCEAQYVLQMAFLWARREYLDKVQEKRGLKGRQELEAEILKIHNGRRGK